MPGPAPKPTKIRALEGNPAHRPLNQSEPDLPEGIRSRPEWLLPEAKREWQRIVGDLERAGVLTSVDRGVLALYCQAWARFVEADQYVTENGPTQTIVSKANGTYDQPRPEVALAQKWYQLALQAAAKLGISPADRSKISLPEKKDNSLDAILGRARTPG